MSDLSVFRGFEPDKVLAELVQLGQLDRRLVGTAWCNRDKKSRAAIIQKLAGEVLVVVDHYDVMWHRRTACFWLPRVRNDCKNPRV